MPASGKHNGKALSASHEPPGRNGAHHSSQPRLMMISPTHAVIATSKICCRFSFITIAIAIIFT